MYSLSTFYLLCQFLKSEADNKKVTVMEVLREKSVRCVINGQDYELYRQQVNSLHHYKYCIYILSVYSPFSDRVGLPLHNIHNPSPFTSIMDIFFVDLKLGHIHFYTL